MRDISFGWRIRDTSKLHSSEVFEITPAFGTRLGEYNQMSTMCHAFFFVGLRCCNCRWIYQHLQKQCIGIIIASSSPQSRFQIPHSCTRLSNTHFFWNLCTCNLFRNMFSLHLPRALVKNDARGVRRGLFEPCLRGEMRHPRVQTFVDSRMQWRPCGT